MALKPSYVICASAHLPSLRLTVAAFGENRALKSCLRLLPSPQPCHGSLIRKVLATWFFGMKMAGPLRGHHGLGTCQHLQAHNGRICVEASLLRLLPPTPRSLCYRLLLCTEEIAHDQTLSPQGRGLAPLPRSSAPLPKNLHTPQSLASVCYTHPWG